MDQQENKVESTFSMIFSRQNIILTGEILLIVAILFFFFNFIICAPKNFPVDSIIVIEKGETLSSTTALLKEKGVIKSEFLFKSFSYIFGGGKIMAGDYYFTDYQNILKIVFRFKNGEYNLTPIKVLITEGSNTKEMAEILAKKLPSFDKKLFLEISSIKEGYLFPDTYLFLPDQKVEDIVSVMENTFTKRLESIKIKITAFNKPLSDIIKMASILEGEARTTETRRIIAGILWKRILLGMPLQVDASFKYINGKDSFNLTTEDLKIDSPYNSYIHKGLPPTPISNPGLDSIISAVTPIKTSYLYFLSDKDGNMHYSATYEEHLANKEKYLSY